MTRFLTVSPLDRTNSVAGVTTTYLRTVFRDPRQGTGPPFPTTRLARADKRLARLERDPPVERRRALAGGPEHGDRVNRVARALFHPRPAG